MSLNNHLSLRISQMLAVFFLFAVTISNSLFAQGKESMADMPGIVAKRTFAVSNGEELIASAGFGQEAPMAKMMSLMMVEGSGMEGMDMTMNMPSTSEKTADKNPPSLDSEKSSKTEASSLYALHVDISPNPPKKGVNKFTLHLTDKASGTQLTGAKLKAVTQMNDMNMGVEEAQFRETAPGVYQADLAFSMNGSWNVVVESAAPIGTSNGNNLRLIFTFHPGDPGLWQQ